MLEDIIRAAFLPQISYTTNVEPNSVKVIVEYPVGTENMDVSVVTPNHSYDITEVPFGNKFWNILMDNTHFSMNFLQKLYNEQLSTIIFNIHIYIILYLIIIYNDSIWSFIHTKFFLFYRNMHCISSSLAYGR